MKKRIFVVLLSLVLTLLLPAQVLVAKTEVEPPKGLATHYLSLGDSIAYGMSAEDGESYYDLYSDYLHQGSSVNLAVPGATTSDLLEALGTKEYQLAVKKADVITISIGGNNLLGPVIGYLYSVYGVSTIEALRQAILSDDDIDTVLNEFLFSIMYGESHIALMAGESAFRSDIIEIYDIIHGINPNAELILLNLYNPFPVTGAIPIFPANIVLYNVMETYLLPMNKLIAVMDMRESRYPNLQIIDVYGTFTLSLLDPVYFNFPFNLDIHPNTYGHSLIYDLLVEVTGQRPPYKFGQIVNNKN